MADERIDVEVNDKVSTGPAKKLRAIGDAAGDAHKYVERLKADLASMNVSGLIKLEQANNSATRAIASQMNAQARLEAATAKTTVATARAATEQQRLATETARTEAAQSRATAAAAKAATATAQAAAAAQRAAAGQNDLASRAERLKVAISGITPAQARLDAELLEAKTLYDANAISIRTYAAAIEHANGKFASATASQNSYNNTVQNTGKSMKMTGQHTANMVAQFNDIGVSLASGQKPWLVLIQQGSQLQYLAGQVEGGFKTLTLSALRMVAPFAALGAVFGVAAAQFIYFKSELDDKAGLDEYAKTLGLTKKELKELGEQHITVGNVLGGVWDTVKEAMNLDPAFESISSAAKSTVNFVWNTFKNFAFGLIALGKATATGFVALWQNFPAIFKDIFAQAVNGAIGLLEGLANKTIDVLNSLGGSFDHVVFKRMENANAGAAANFGKTVKDAAVSGFKEAEAGYDAFVKRASANAIKRGRASTLAAAQKLIDDRGAGPKGKVDKTEENRALALSKINAELDNELSRMKMLKDARAEQQRFDQIAEQLLGKKIKLSDDETASIKAKIKAIEDYKYIQAESDRLYEAAVGPARDMNSTVEAATALYDAGKISLDAYSGALLAATTEFEKATDPLYDLNKAYDEGAKYVGLYGDALAQAQYLESIDAAYKAKNLSMYDATTGKLKEEVVALMAKNAALRDQQAIQSTVAGIIQPMLDDQKMLENKAAYYAEVDRLRQADVLSESQATQAKAALDAKFWEMKLSGASSAFGELASLQSSSNKELATIGKAAAVADATIKGFLAVQNALGTVPYPFNLAAAAAIAIKTGANVAGIMSTNVGNFATGGQFMVEGRAGIDNNNINMNVSKGERVTIETAAQQRQNDGSSGATLIENKQKIVNLVDSRDFISAMDSEEGEEVVMNIIGRRRDDVNQITGNK